MDRIYHAWADCHLPNGNSFSGAETTKPLTSFEIRGSGYIEFGGEGEIRTLDTISCIHTFQACSLSHSDTSPYLFKHVLSVEAR